jgi:hypothetical protein
MVRCPWCEYEFALDHALMNAEEAPPEHIAEFPPELIPTIVEGSPPAGDSSSAGQLPAPDSEASPQAVAGETGAVDVLASPSEAAVVDLLAAPAETAVADPLAAPAEAAVVDVLAAPAETAVADPLAAPAEAAVVDVLAAPAETVVADPLAAPAEAAVVDVLAAPAGVPLPAGEVVVGPEPSETPGAEGAAEPAFAVPLRRQQRKAHPIRNLIGLVVSGMLGLAVAYGLLNWLGPAKLKFWNRPRPQATEGADSNSAAKLTRSGPESGVPPKLPEIGSKDEFSGLENRTFETPKDVQPVRPAKARK